MTNVKYRVWNHNCYLARENVCRLVSNRVVTNVSHSMDNELFTEVWESVWRKIEMQAWTQLRSNRE